VELAAISGQALNESPASWRLKTVFFVITPFWYMWERSLLFAMTLNWNMKDINAWPAERNLTCWLMTDSLAGKRPPF
jgi:hypothetical protein